MAKVRFSQKCAGGCGTWLVVGSQATRLHRGWWCGPCVLAHRPGCERLQRAVPGSDTRDGVTAGRVG